MLFASFWRVWGVRGLERSGGGGGEWGGGGEMRYSLVRGLRLRRLVVGGQETIVHL